MIHMLADIPGQIATVAERWKRQYCHCGLWSSTHSGDSKIVYDKLAKLNPKKATAETVARIIGNSSWVGYRCSNCQKTVGVALRAGQPEDYESETVTLCRDCGIEVGKMARKMSLES